MSLSAAMLVGFTGIQSNQVTVDTVGDNLANLNTTAFKHQRTLFETLLYRNLSEGTAPTAETGGTLPQQIGSGSTVAAIQRNFVQGSFDSTGFPSDLAIDGKGFFVLQDAGGDQVYTRDGAFTIDDTSTLVSQNGQQVLAFPAAADGSIEEGTLSSLIIPLGSTSDPIATSSVLLDGHLSPAGDIAGSGAVLTSQPLLTNGGAAATDTTPLTGLVDESGVQLFNTDDSITVNGRKGGASIPQATFVVGTDGTTLGDLAAYMESVFGIDTDPATGGAPGITVTDGALVVSSNLGTTNAIQLDGGSITNATSPSSLLFDFAQTQAATGASATTSYQVRDSLGNPVELRLRFVLESKSDASATWRFYAESQDDTDLSPVLGSGTVTFDQSGRFLSAAGTTLSIDRQGVGSATPLTFDLDLSGVVGLPNPDGSSEIVVASDDGKEAGVMVGYEVDDDGIVTGKFTNETEVVLGQIALATFINEEGLVAVSENVYEVGVNSGPPSIVAPSTSNAGAVKSGRLEQSNVEIAREFINLISAATGISAASRVVRTSDELLQELLLLAR